VVRRLVGYARLEAPALAALERIHDLARDYVNFLHPVRKLQEKVRHGSRITRRYDTAQTPYRRLLASGVLPRKSQNGLAVRSKAVDPCASSSKSRPPSARWLNAQFGLLSFTRFGRNLYEAATTSLVGSSREAIQDAAAVAGTASERGITGCQLLVLAED